MLPILQESPKTALEISLILKRTKKWNEDYTKNVIEAAHAMGLAAYDNERWHTQWDENGRWKHIKMQPRRIDPVEQPISGTPLDTDDPRHYGSEYDVDPVSEEYLDDPCTDDV